MCLHYITHTYYLISQTMRQAAPWTNGWWHCSIAYEWVEVFEAAAHIKSKLLVTAVLTQHCQVITNNLFIGRSSAYVSSSVLHLYISNHQIIIFTGVDRKSVSIIQVWPTSGHHVNAFVTPDWNMTPFIVFISFYVTFEMCRFAGNRFFITNDNQTSNIWNITGCLISK